MSRASARRDCLHWERIRRGDEIPQEAVHAGRTATDGNIFVALNQDGDLGKLNTDLFSGKAKNIWCPSSDTPTEEGWILIKKGDAIVAWRAVKKGQLLPDTAVFAGERFGEGEGPMYVGRNVHGSRHESGRLLIDDDGFVRSIQCHHTGSHDAGEALVFDPRLLPEVNGNAEKDKSARHQGWQARWMWYDNELPANFMPGLLRSVVQKSPLSNPLKWSSWQDLPSTLRDLEGYRDTQHAGRAVRIETLFGVCDVYETTTDLIRTLRTILTGDA